jgi:hypothetical protein
MVVNGKNCSRRGKMMYRKKYDGVIEAVRYSPEGWLSLARVYERVGAAFTDRILLTRDQLIERLRNGKRFMIGQRRTYMAGTFDVSSQVRLSDPPGKETLYITQPTVDRDDLQGTPLF